MPPSGTTPVDPKDHLLPEGHAPKSGVGPVVAIIIILAMLLLGAIYYYGQLLNERHKNDANNLPLIPADENAAVDASASLSQ